MNDEMTALSIDETFRFSCNSRVSCFNECCRDLNQFLTPYDILRLKKNTGMTSTDFLQRYTSQHIGPESNLPVITLKPDSSDELKCPFVTPEGCSVYEDRPSSCRTYPLARMASRSRETGEITEFYALIEEPHCKGFEQDNTQTVGEWIKDQGIAPYNEMNDLLMEIISLKNRFIPGMMDMKSKHMFHLACYDIDTFKNQIFNEGLLDDMDIDSQALESIKNDDEALLKLGIKWLKQVLFADRNKDGV